MPGQRFGYPVGSHYTGFRGVRAYRNHIRSTAYRSSAWRAAAQAYAKGIGRFALRGAGYIGAAATAAELGYLAYKKYRMPLVDSYRPRVGRGRRRPVGGVKRWSSGGDQGPPSKMPRYNAGGNPSVSTVARVKGGRHKSFQRKALSLIKASLVPYVDRFGRLTSTYDASNVYPLEFATYDAGVNYNYPVYLYELNTSPDGTTAGLGAPLMVLRRNQATGNYSFQPQSSQNSDNTAVTYIPTLEYNGDNSTSTVGLTGPYVYMDWADVRISCVGPKKTPAKFTVQLVRFLDEGCMPPCFSTPAGTPSATPTVVNGRDQPSAGDDLREWNAGWNEFLAHLLGNPISIRANMSNSKRWAVMKTFSKVFQPRLTTEDSITGGTGDTVHVKWFQNIARTFTYGTASGVANVTAQEEIDPQEGHQGFSSNGDSHAKQRARMFLLISAFTPVLRDGTTDRATSDVCCQFDIQVRRKFYYMDHI